MDDMGKTSMIYHRAEVTLTPVTVSLIFIFLATLLVPRQSMAAEPLFVNPPAALQVSDVDLLLPNLTGIVADLPAARALGKALFWDMRLGSDNLACASCHFHAGADNRSKNQLNPGLNRVNNPARTANSDSTFGDGSGKTGFKQTAGANYKLTPFDFPFHRTLDRENRNSAITYDTNDVTSSQGSFGGFLLTGDPDPTRFPDFCGGNDNTFLVNGVPVRKVEPRNTPTTINAIFNHRNFWDGRANNVFNGVSPFGPRDLDARVVTWNADTLSLETLALVNSSLASQAVGPPLSAFEMACSGRSFKDLGRGMLSSRALAIQAVHGSDSVLNTYRDGSGLGLNATYMQLIQAAFAPKYWNDSTTTFQVINNGLGAGPEIVIPGAPEQSYTQAEHNFSMFFGIAIMLYEATLVSNQTPYDTFITQNTLINNGAGTIVAQAGAVTFVPGFGQRELLGLDVFMNKGKCYECHFGPEFTSASVRVRGLFPRAAGEVAEPIETMTAVDGFPSLYDGGFYNIGARPTHEDLGVGGKDPFGNTLSFARNLVQTDIAFQGNRISVDGAFKTPTIRNVELTGPYMHNGGHSTLKQVVEFYDRGGDRRDILPLATDCTVTDTSGFGTTAAESHCTNLPPPIGLPLGLTEAEIDALVAFMLSLTDERVKHEVAPFDHPELIIPSGHEGSQFAVATVPVNPTDPGGGEILVRAKDKFTVLPAVGIGGRLVENLPPLGTFLGLNPFSLGVPQLVVPQITPLLLEN